MDDVLSSSAQDFVEKPVTHDDDDDVDDAEDEDAILKREKLLEEDIEAVFSDSIVVDDDDNDNDNESDSSDDDGSNNDSKSSDEEGLQSHNSSQSDVEQSSVKESYEHSAHPNEPNQHSALIKDIPQLNPLYNQHSAITDSDVNCSRAQDEQFSRNLDEHDSKDSDVYNSRDSDVHNSKNSDVFNSRDSNVHNSRNSIDNDARNSKFNPSYTPDFQQTNAFFGHKTSQKNLFEHKSNVITENHTESFLKGTTIGSGLQIYDQHDYGDVSSRIPPTQFNYQSELRDEYAKLQVLYNSRGNELEQVKRDEIRAKETFEKGIKSLKLKLKYIEGEKDKLTSSLEEAQNVISDITHENNILKGKLTALELQFSAEKKTKETAQNKLESAEITIQSLEQQLKESVHSENALRLKQQNENVVKDLRLRHQKEVLKLKEDIDKLQENLNAKAGEAETLSAKLSQQQKKYEELQNEKCDIFNKLSAKLDSTQKEYRELLESGSYTEVSKLKLQVQHLKEENSKLEKQISPLKDEVKSLQGELRTAEAVKTFALGKESLLEKNKKDRSRHSESDLKTELQNSLKNIQSLRTQNDSLKEKLEELMHKLPVEEEKAKLFESRYNESESKRRELEKKLEEVLPAGSIPVFEHEKKVKSLESELVDCQKKLRDISISLKTSSTIQDKLRGDNESLKSTISKMQEERAEERVKITELCRRKYLEIHENYVANLKQELTSKAESQMKAVCWDYENKITELQKDIDYLNDQMFESKSQYVKAYEENKSLKSKIDSMSQTKERKELEREIRLAYEKKLDKVKEQIENEKSQFESTLKSEMEKAQVEWTNQKMTEIKKFVDQTKQQLDDKFVTCINKEKQKFEAEKKKILDECQEKIDMLQEKYETETSDLSKNFQQKWESEMNQLQQKHHAEMQSVTEKFEQKIAHLENEITILKEKNTYDFELKAEIEKANIEVMQYYETEKENYAAELRDSFQKKWKSGIKELQQSHQNEVESLTKKFKDQIVKLETEIKTLKESLLKESKLEDVQLLKEEFANEKLALENKNLDLIKNEHVLKSKLSTAIEVEKKLLEKLKKYKKYVKTLQDRHKEKTDAQQKKNEELKKSIVDKESELQLVKHEFDSYKNNLEQTHHKYSRLKNSQSQTEDEVVPRRTLLNVYEMFTQCLKNISEEIKVFVMEYRKRSVERLKKALSFYHDHLISKIFQDVIKDARSISPNVGIPKLSKNLKSVGSSSDNLNSPNAVHHQLNSNLKISNSTPVDVITSDNTHKNLEFQLNNVSNIKAFQNAALNPDFADMSFDFVPIKMHDLEHTSVKLPQYSLPGGLLPGQNVFHSYSDRNFPLSHIK